MLSKLVNNPTPSTWGNLIVNIQIQYYLINNQTGGQSAIGLEYLATTVGTVVYWGRKVAL